MIEQLINRCIIASPSEVWAARVHPDMDAADGLAKLWSEVMHVCRLDEDDPVLPERSHEPALVESPKRLSGRASTPSLQRPRHRPHGRAVPHSRWMAASFTTAAGLEHHPNLPSEEVFTTPIPSA